jgi:hypothetical protein
MGEGLFEQGLNFIKNLSPKSPDGKAVVRTVNLGAIAAIGTELVTGCSPKTNPNAQELVIADAVKTQMAERIDQTATPLTDDEIQAAAEKTNDAYIQQKTTPTAESTQTPAEVDPNALAKQSGLETSIADINITYSYTKTENGTFLKNNLFGSYDAQLQSDGTWKVLDESNQAELELKYGHLLPKDYQYIQNTHGDNVESTEPGKKTLYTIIFSRYLGVSETSTNSSDNNGKEYKVVAGFCDASGEVKTVPIKTDFIKDGEPFHYLSGLSVATPPHNGVSRTFSLEKTATIQTLVEKMAPGTPIKIYIPNNLTKMPIPQPETYEDGVGQLVSNENSIYLATEYNQHSNEEQKKIFTSLDTSEIWPDNVSSYNAFFTDFWYNSIEECPFCDNSFN